MNLTTDYGMMNCPDWNMIPVHLFLPVARRPSSLSLWPVHSLETSKPRARSLSKAINEKRAET
jgi:hypothetical protein